MGNYRINQTAPRQMFVTRIVCTTLSALSRQAVWAAERERRPNIVLVFVGDMG